jgi:hypothetical protein
MARELDRLTVAELFEAARRLPTEEQEELAAKLDALIDPDCDAPPSRDPALLAELDRNRAEYLRGEGKSYTLEELAADISDFTSGRA